MGINMIGDLLFEAVEDINAERSVMGENHITSEVDALVLIMNRFREALDSPDNKVKYFDADMLRKIADEHG